MNGRSWAMSTIYVQKDGQKLGPFTTEELEGKVGEGVFSPQDLYWTEGMDDWQPLAGVIAENETQEQEQQETAVEPAVEEGELLFDSPDARLTSEALYLGGEEIPILSIEKASAQTETVRRAKPITGTILLGVVVVCVALIEIPRSTVTHWVIWGAILLGLFLWWLRLFVNAVRPASTVLIVDLRDGDERILPMDPAPANELAGAINQAVAESLEQERALGEGR